MKQYCRYCTHAHYGDVVYCDTRNKTMSGESAKRANMCKDFDFNEIDVFGGVEADGRFKAYRPRGKKAEEPGQIKMF